MKSVSPVWIAAGIFFLVHLLFAVRAGFRICRSDSPNGRKIAQVVFSLLVPIVGPLIAMAVHTESREGRERAGAGGSDHSSGAIQIAAYDANSEASDVGEGHE